MPVLLESMKYFQPSRTINYRDNETPFLLNLHVLACYLYIMVNKIYQRTITVCAEPCMAIMDLRILLGQARPGRKKQSVDKISINRNIERSNAFSAGIFRPFRDLPSCHFTGVPLRSTPGYYVSTAPRLNFDLFSRPQP
jgi:hypothetical protein